MNVIKIEMMLQKKLIRKRYNIQKKFLMKEIDSKNAKNHNHEKGCSSENHLQITEIFEQMTSNL